MEEKARNAFSEKKKFPARLEQGFQILEKGKAVNLLEQGFQKMSARGWGKTSSFWKRVFLLLLGQDLKNLSEKIVSN